MRCLERQQLLETVARKQWTSANMQLFPRSFHLFLSRSSSHVGQKWHSISIRPWVGYEVRHCYIVALSRSRWSHSLSFPLFLFLLNVVTVGVSDKEVRRWSASFALLLAQQQQQQQQQYRQNNVIANVVTTAAHSLVPHSVIIVEAARTGWPSADESSSSRNTYSLPYCPWGLL